MAQVAVLGTFFCPQRLVCSPAIDGTQDFQSRACRSTRSMSCLIRCSVCDMAWHREILAAVDIGYIAKYSFVHGRNPLRSVLSDLQSS